ncbi:RraA family protein [Levilactobacillus fujinensis]|uniref:Putative 4-hydroxy-4-methyl-2-oxoglutarate aldolase n=1 Tax=Levilactobacillus fujinensis TaxID=2486024 RepID=A0ABW1TCS4_9LACO|nr:RraA family protein [Levilactobacillus fujinensis]
MSVYDEFKGIPTGNICDVNGLYGAMEHDIKPLSTNFSFSGEAYTVDCPARDNLTIHKAIAEARPGSVLVVNCHQFVDAGIFGEMLATSCIAKGLKGIVIDGACRDKAELIHLGFPVFSRAVCPNGTNKADFGAVQNPIICGGLPVKPGDVIIGDADGVVVIAKSKAETILRLAKAKMASELKLKSELAKGKTTADLFNYTRLWN